MLISQQYLFVSDIGNFSQSFILKRAEIKEDEERTNKKEREGERNPNPVIAL